MAGKFRSSPRLQCFLVAMLAISATKVVAADDDIRKCAKIADDSDRLSCYDEMAEDRQRRMETGAVEKSQSDPNTDRVDTAGPSGEEFELQARVSRCEKSADGRYYFFLDNNEVWKQTKSDRHRYKDCTFSVTITRDWFGYKMLIDDGERTIRIKRVR